MGPLEVRELVEQLGIPLQDPEIVRQALVHSSFFNENPQLVPGHNERLEFLGDAVIGLVVSRLLYERHPSEDEGFLTARRAALVNRDALAGMAQDLGLDELLLLGRGEAEAGGASRPSLLAGTFEAVAGAVALSNGLPDAIAWLSPQFEERINAPGDDPPLKSAKSRLQEWTQRWLRTKPRYEVLSAEGPPHDQTFTVAAVVDGRRVATGTGSSRHRAEEEAAEDALAELERTHPADAEAADSR